MTKDEILHHFAELAKYPGFAFAFPEEDMEAAGFTLETLPKQSYRYSVEAEHGNVLIISQEG